MKKFLALLLAAMMVLSLAACTPTKPTETEAPQTTTEADTTVEDTTAEDTTEEAQGVMTYAEYAAANVDDAVTVMFTVQATQSWWDNKITVYGADEDGAYFCYNMACSEEAAKNLVGSVICVTGFKAEYAGELELAAEATFEFVDGGTPYVAEAKDLTDKIASEELIDYQNQLATFKGLTVKSVSKKESDSDPDLYLCCELDGAEYNFCVENYLCGPSTEVYQTVAALTEGQVVDVTGFLYWYNGMNPHVTAVTVK